MTAYIRNSSSKSILKKGIVADSALGFRNLGGNDTLAATIFDSFSILEDNFPAFPILPSNFPTLF